MSSIDNNKNTEKTKQNTMTTYLNKCIFRPNTFKFCNSLKVNKVRYGKVE